MASLRNEISQLRNELQVKTDTQKVDQNNYSQRGRYSRRYFSRRRRCQNCETNNNVRCFHCFTCGSSAHMMSVCPEKNV